MKILILYFHCAANERKFSLLDKANEMRNEVKIMEGNK